MKDISFSLDAGSRLALTGVSGVGKSTLCRITAGLELPDSGAVILDGKPVNGPTAAATMVFQHYPCFDWLTVRGNIAFGMGPGRNGEVQALIERVGLRDATNLYPAQLSGGMRQRVAIARALAVRPRVLLLDEPFTALDPITKRQLHELILTTQQDLGFALVVALHSLDDVYALATDVLCLAGRPASITDEFQPCNMPFDDLRARVERAIDTVRRTP